MSNKSNNQSNNPKSSSNRGGFGGGPAHMVGSGEKAKNFGKTMKKLIEYLQPFSTSMIFVFVFAIASTIFAVLAPRILGNATNIIVDGYINRAAYDQVVAKIPNISSIPAGVTIGDIIKNIPAQANSQIKQVPSDKLAKISSIRLDSRPSIDFNAISKIALTLIILYVLSAIFTYIQGWIMSDVSQKISYKFRKDIAKKINRMPLKYFDSRTHGEVQSRVTNDIDTVSQTLNQSLTQIITSVVTIIGFLIIMFSINWQMTLVALLILPISMFFVITIVKKSQSYFKSQQDSLGHINGHVEEMYGGHNVMKVFNGEKRSIKKFRDINNKLYDSAWKSQFYSGLMFPIMNFLGNLGYVGVAVLGGYLAVNGKVKIGDIQAFIQYVTQFNQPIIQTANVANVLQSTAAAAERVFEFLSEEDEIEDIKNPIKISNVRCEINFDQVVFGYEPDKTIINGFDTIIKPGQRVAIVGPTGAGKTTMVNLLMRFYDVNSGAIKIDGVDIRNISRSSLRKLFGMVLQDAWLFNGTIRENISYSKPDATYEEVVRAAKAASADHFICALPNAYDDIIGEETDNISQGEKQLLTIARAMLADPPMLILDEATSSVDTRTEILIQKAMDNLMKGRTSFIIAHRLSTIRNADLILVMRDGNIVEQGTHNSLLKQNGFYASLYNSQFSLAANE